MRAGTRVLAVVLAYVLLLVLVCPSIPTPIFTQAGKICQAGTACTISVPIVLVRPVLLFSSAGHFEHVTISSIALVDLLCRRLC